jgi:hypothetical protein
MANQHHRDKRPRTWWLDVQQTDRLDTEAQRRTEIEGRRVYPVDLVRAGIDLILSPELAEVPMQDLVTAALERSLPPTQDG